MTLSAWHLNVKYINRPCDTSNGRRHCRGWDTGKRQACDWLTTIFSTEEKVLVSSATPPM